MKRSRALWLRLTVALFHSFVPDRLPAVETVKPNPGAPSRSTPLVFPNLYLVKWMKGYLVSADFILRKGQFRTVDTGELVDFTMEPYATVNYLGAEADLREVPLGGVYNFELNQDEEGNPTKLVRMEDRYTGAARVRVSYKVTEVQVAEGKVQLTRLPASLGPEPQFTQTLRVTGETRIWKGEQRIQLADVKPGDVVMFHDASTYGKESGWCMDLWVGPETLATVTAAQRTKYLEYIKARGLPGWVTKTDDKAKTLTVVLFSGDSKLFKQAYHKELEVGRTIKTCVANEELRTWNPPVDGEGGRIMERLDLHEEGLGSSGVHIVVSVSNMLEGFRRGRVVRLFCEGWKAQDQYYGESLMGYGFGRMQNLELVENVAKDYPEQFPFRTDHGNRSLPWYQVQAGVVPPPFSEHVVLGELVKVDAATRTGQFRKDKSGEVVDFALLPEGGVKYLNADAVLADLPVGTRCRFHLYQDEKGAFTKASLVTDEFTRYARNATTMRVVSLKLARGEVVVAHQIPEVKDYNGDMKRPPDIAHSLLRVDARTVCWKGTEKVPVTALAVGDALLVNVSGELPGAPWRCTEVWVGEETQKRVTEAQKKKHDERVKAEKLAQKKPAA